VEQLNKNMRGKKRITVRLGDAQWKVLADFCETTGHDHSYAVRKALDSLCTPGSDSSPSSPSPRPLSLPDQVLRLTTKYRAWARGDLRDERTEQYNELLALAFTCKELFPKTNGVREFYTGLLELNQFIETH
jgi:hypothetical protein